MLQTNQVDACDGHYVAITAETWNDVIDSLNVVEVTRRAEMPLSVPLPLDARAISLPENQSAPSQVNEKDSSNDDKVTIKVVLPSGEIQTAEILREMRVDKLVADARQMLGHRLTHVTAVLGGVIMLAERSIRSYNIKDGDFINLEVQEFPRTKKPVIYLYSPSDIDVSVKLSLIPEWSPSVIYPVVTTEDHGQRLEWNVRTHQDGSLTEHNSGLDVSYLFWEAE
ncbi:hypothetical protein F4604DRAFT_71991 [Suillus subluteus]|nr:hypothetical protein F4604DRAFT_71991 [Suillus subluteus]